MTYPQPKTVDATFYTVGKDDQDRRVLEGAHEVIEVQADAPDPEDQA